MPKPHDDYDSSGGKSKPSLEQIMGVALVIDM